MLKMYHTDPYSGNTPDYWANSWDEIEFEAALQLCYTDPLRPVFDKYISADSLILEGGCGKGHWVAYFADKGSRIIGLDFAERTLAELSTNRDGLSLVGGNVNALPFADGTFDAYYSGGVVEHFEAGCGPSLDEAHRVLKDDGTLLLSVPYYSPLRKLLTPFRRMEWRRLTAPTEDKAVVFPGLTYFQYAYDLREFETMLLNAGFRTVETLGYSIIWGLYDLKFLNRRAEKKRLSGLQKGHSAVDGDGGGKRSRSFLKDLVLGEETSTTLTRLSTRFMRWSCANMMMFVCRKP